MANRIDPQNKKRRRGAGKESLTKRDVAKAILRDHPHLSPDDIVDTLSSVDISDLNKYFQKDSKIMRGDDWVYKKSSAYGAPKYLQEFYSTWIESVGQRKGAGIRTPEAREALYNFLNQRRKKMKLGVNALELDVIPVESQQTSRLPGADVNADGTGGRTEKELQVSVSEADPMRPPVSTQAPSGTPPLVTNKDAVENKSSSPSLQEKKIEIKEVKTMAEPQRTEPVAEPMDFKEMMTKAAEEDEFVTGERLLAPTRRLLSVEETEEPLSSYLNPSAKQNMQNPTSIWGFPFWQKKSTLEQYVKDWLYGRLADDKFAKAFGITPKFIEKKLNVLKMEFQATLLKGLSDVPERVQRELEGVLAESIPVKKIYEALKHYADTGTRPVWLFPKDSEWAKLIEEFTRDTLRGEPLDRRKVAEKLYQVVRKSFSENSAFVQAGITKLPLRYEDFVDMLAAQGVNFTWNAAGGGATVPPTGATPAPSNPGVQSDGRPGGPAGGPAGGPEGKSYEVKQGQEPLRMRGGGAPEGKGGQGGPTRGLGENNDRALNQDTKGMGENNERALNEDKKGDEKKGDEKKNDEGKNAREDAKDALLLLTVVKLVTENAGVDKIAAIAQSSGLLNLMASTGLLATMVANPMFGTALVLIKNYLLFRSLQSAYTAASSVFGNQTIPPELLDQAKLLEAELLAKADKVDVKAAREAAAKAQAMLDESQDPLKGAEQEGDGGITDSIKNAWKTFTNYFGATNDGGKPPIDPTEPGTSTPAPVRRDRPTEKPKPRPTQVPAHNPYQVDRDPGVTTTTGEFYDVVPTPYTTEPMLRPEFYEGGSDFVTEVNRDVKMQTIDELMWQSFKNYQWESNQTSDNPLWGLQLAEEGARFTGPLLGEEDLPLQEESAAQETVFANKELRPFYNIIPGSLDTFMSVIPLDGEVNVDDSLESRIQQSERDFRNVDFPDWLSIPDNTPFERFTAADGTQLPDKELTNPGTISSYWWESSEGENQFIFNTKY